MVSLPGLAEKDFELKIEGRSLIIMGERKPHENDGYTFHQQESRFGSFSRSFALSDTVDIENIKADYKHGILVVTIPQKPEIKPRTIKVNV
jgi:HSP20 family protein